MCYNGAMVKKHKHYNRWLRINQRCYNSRCKDYCNYGARGITNWWHEDSAGFVSYLDEVLGVCPPGYTLDRVDNDKNYEPGNLRWGSRHTQSTNQRERKDTIGYKWVLQWESGGRHYIRGQFKWFGVTYRTRYCDTPADAYLQVLALRSIVCPLE